MSLYHDLIIDHYKNPRNFGVLENPNATAQEANASCGDLIEFSLIINHKTCPESVEGSLIIHGVKWRGVGCAISTAAASLLSEQIRSKKYGVKKIMEITDEEMVKMLGGNISPTRLKCATLALKALQKALKNSHANL